MMATVLVEGQCLIPGDLATLAAFRRWAASEEFPQTGRIDWLSSHIEVDMSPEDIFTHGTLKTAIVGRLWPLARDRGIHLFTGETRVSSVAGDLSVEPDVVAVSDATIDTGRVRLVPASGSRPDRFAELEGAPDLVVEIVSDASVKKDTERLPAAYHAAGIREFWLIDARGAEVRFTIHRWEPTGYVASITADGHGSSTVFGCGFALVRSRNAAGRFIYDLAPVG
jgi:Uma2 family endonuclease